MVRRTLRALLAALLLALCIIVTPGTAAAEGPEYIDVEITSVSSPTLDVSDPDQVVELSGTLTNTSTVPVTWLEVEFWRLTSPISTPSALTDLTTNPQLLPFPGRLFDEDRGNRHVLRLTDQFGPGEREQFTVRATLGDLGFVDGDVAYLVGVQARGLPADGPKRTLGRDQIAMPATTDPVDSSALVMLTATPSWLPDGPFLDDSLLDDLDGRLDTLLASAERPEVTAAIDPSLYEAVQRLTRPHLVGDSERPGSGIALRWLDRVDALADDGRLWILPYGNPDLVRADASGMLHQVLTWARDSVPGDLARLPTVAVLDDDSDNDLITRIAEFDTIVVRNSTGTSPGPPTILGAAAQGPWTSLSGDIRHARRIAEELLSARPPLYLIDTPEAAVADAEADAGRRHVPIQGEPAEPLTLPQAPAPAPWTDVTAALGEVSAHHSFVADLTGQELPDDHGRLGALAFSEGFASESAAASYVRAAAPPRLDTSLIELRAAQSFVMGARENTFPVTFTNGLAIPVQVQLRFRSESPQRINVPPTELITVEPGQSATIEITPQATANGVTLVHAQAVTAAGVPLGGSQVIEITATDLGRVGWLIILVSGAVVVGGTAWRIRAVRSQRAEEERESGQ